MAVFRRGDIGWYKFYFAGRPIRESSKSTSKTVAKAAEQQRRRELEAGFHNIREERQQRIRCLKDIIEEYMEGYRVRYRSPAFAEYALGHVARLLGSELAVDIDSPAVLRYQENRLREGAAPKSINEEVRFLLKMLGEAGEVIRARLRKSKQLKLAVSNWHDNRHTLITNWLKVELASRKPAFRASINASYMCGLFDCFA